MKTRFSLSRYAASYIALGVLAFALFALPLWRFQLLVEPVWYGILGAFALILSLGHMLAWRNRRLLLVELNEIKQAEQRYALVMSASNDGFWDWKVAGDELYVSPRFLEMFDFPPDTTFAGRAALFKRLSMPAADREALERAVAEHFAGKTVRTDIEFRARVRGEERWMRATGRATRDASGAVSRWNGAVRDVTARRRAQEALRRSEERFRSLTELSNDFFWETDAQHRYTAIELGRAYIGVRNSGSKLGLARWEIPYASPDEVAWAAHRAAIAARECFVDFRFSRIEEGEERFYEHSGEPRYDAQGTFLGYRGVGRDVTARKRAEEALRESEQRYELAIAASESGYWDWHVLTDRYFVSPKALELAGFAPETTFASRADFMTRNPMHPEDRARWAGAVKDLFAGTGERLAMEVRYIVGGEIRWHSLQAICRRDDTGKVVRWSGSATDVTARKLAEEALCESEKRYERAMLASNAGLWEWDALRDEYYMSPRHLELLGLAPGTTFSGREDFLRRVPFHPEDLERWRQAQRQLFASGGSYLVMDLRVIGDGETRWVRVNALCFREDEGRVVRWSGSVTDVTQAKRAEGALRRSEERYSLAMDASEEGHFDVNLETDEHFISERLNEIHGFRPGTRTLKRSEFIKHVCFYGDDAEKFHAAIAAAEAKDGPERYECEFRIVRPSGEVRWLRTCGKVTRDAEGRARRRTGVVADITQRKLAEEALRASEERYSLAMEASEEGHFDLNIETGEIFVSERLNEIYGFAPGTRFANRDEYLAQVRLHAEDVERYHAALDAAVARQGPERYEFEFRIVRPSGQVRWLRTRGKVTRDAEGRACRRTGVVADITERKLAIDTLRESEARFRSLTEVSSDWYWRQDENLRFTYLSEGVSERAGWPSEDYIGRLRWEVPDIHLISCSWEEHKEVLAKRQPFRDLEYWRPGKDGTITYTSISGMPIYDENGSFVGYHGVGRNITERKRIEEELRSRQEMLELAQKSAQAIAFEWRIGAAGEGQNRWSPDLEAMYGLAPGTYDGSFERWKKLVHPEDWPAMKRAIKHAHQTGEVASEYRVIHPDGSVHWLQAKGRMLFDGEGKPTRMVGFMQDVTQRRQAEDELKRMERQLRQAQRLEAMGTLAGGIAHDFNNILGAILGFGEMALRDAAKGTRLRRDLGSIMTAGERGRALVDRVLAFSRSGVGERVAVHVERGVREALDLLAAKLPQGIRIEATLRAGRAAMLGDPTQVHQVLMNLGTNAVQAMTAGGMLSVSLDAVHFDTPRPATIGTVGAGDYIVLKVADEGIGIPAEIVERIFDPFFTTKEVGTGTGLGLSLVHGIVAEVGGAIDVASTPGAGSTFTVYLPRSGDALDSLREEELEMPRGDGQRVLVVDDEEPLVKLATRTLEDLGYSAAGFTSSAAALSAFRAEPERFQALITDERMPGMSGSALIREVRIIHKSIPIVLMSGFVGGPVLRSAREAGADEVLKKPLSARDLANSLARVLHP